jgi:hypothetical protein
MIMLIWLLVAYGMSNILVYGSIFQGIRDSINDWGNSMLPFNRMGKFIGDLLSCMMCTSVWVGFFLSISYYSPSISFIKTPQWCGWFFDGILSSGAVWAINAIVEWFEENRLSNQKQEVTHITPEDETNNN